MVDLFQLQNKMLSICFVHFATEEVCAKTTYLLHKMYPPPTNHTVQRFIGVDHDHVIPLYCHQGVNNVIRPAGLCVSIVLWGQQSWAVNNTQ